MEVLENEAVEDLFRFALLLTGKRSEALGCVAEALEESGTRAAQFRAERSRWIWTARWLWDRLRKRLPLQIPQGDLAPELIPFFEALTVKERAALALRAISHLEISEIAQVLNQRPRELRQLLADLFEVRQVAGLDEMVLRDGVVAMRPTPEEYSALVTTWPPRKVVRTGRSERAIGVAAVVFGVLFIVAFVFLERWRNADSNLAHEQAVRLLEYNGHSNSAEFEPLDGTPAKLGDWLYLHGMESVHIPAPLDKLKLVGGRVAQWRGAELAQLVSENPKAVLFIVDAAAFAADGSGAIPGQLSGSGWSVRWQSAGRYLLLLAVPGGHSDLEAMFAGLDQ